MAASGGGRKTAASTWATKMPRTSKRAVRLVEPFTSHPGSVLRGEWGDPIRRGENFCDWDNNEFHFTNGKFAPGDTSLYDVVKGMAAIPGENPPYWVEAIGNLSS